jgi:hypothetical protein
VSIFGGEFIYDILFCGQEGNWCKFKRKTKVVYKTIAFF